MSHTPSPEHRRAGPYPADHCLVEWYRPGVVDESVADSANRIAAAAALLSVDGAAAELLLTVVLPGDEVAFCLFAATSPALAEQACRRAGCRTTRTTGSVTTAVRAGLCPTPVGRSTTPTAAIPRVTPTVHTTPTARRPS